MSQACTFGFRGQAVASIVQISSCEVVTQARGAPLKWSKLFRGGKVLNSTGRYLHRKRYVEEVAIKNHFDVLYLKSVVLRMNAGQPVHGLVGVLVTV